MRSIVMLFLSALVLTTGAQRAAAQVTIPSDPTPRPGGFESPKSPTTARLLAIIPSAGHIYAGETGRGLAFAGGMAGVMLIGTALLVGDCFADVVGGTGPAEEDECSSSDAIGNVVTVAFLGVWGWSIYDAGSAARRTNARRGISTSLLIAPSRHGAGATRGGAALRLGVSLKTH